MKWIFCAPVLFTVVYSLSETVRFITSRTRKDMSKYVRLLKNQTIGTHNSFGDVELPLVTGRYDTVIFMLFLSTSSE